MSLGTGIIPPQLTEITVMQTISLIYFVHFNIGCAGDSSYF